MKPNGAIFYRGPSLLDGRPIVGIVTGLSKRTRNPKTGDMLQTWILRDRIDPLDAIHSGGDASICGDCALRGHDGKQRSCYVQVKNAPLQVWRALKRGNYPRLKLGDLKGRSLRMGSYGDPAAIPLHVWQFMLTASGETWTGYTHQWRHLDRGYADILMASVDNEDDRAVADALGWRTFRTLASIDTLLDSSEVRCPASAEMQHRTTCEHCSLCKGQRNPAKSIAIVAHGGTAVVSNYARKISGRRLLPMVNA